MEQISLMNEFKTPRFLLTGFFTLTTTFAYLFTEKMNSDQYIMVIGVILSIYGAHKILRGGK